MPSDKEETRYKGVRIREVNGTTPEDSLELDVENGHFSLPLLRVKRVAEKEERKRKGNFPLPSSVAQNKKIRSNQQTIGEKYIKIKIKKIGHSPAVHQPTENNIIPQLQNIVSTVNMGVKLDLKKIALHARNAEFNPKRFAAVIMRIREPRTTALIFSSGKMVCTGAKSEEDSRLAARKYARIVQKLGFPTKFKDFKIQNMVGSCDVKFPIRLEGLVLTHSQVG